MFLCSLLWGLAVGSIFMVSALPFSVPPALLPVSSTWLPELEQVTDALVVLP